MSCSLRWSAGATVTFVVAQATILYPYPSAPIRRRAAVLPGLARARRGARGQPRARPCTPASTALSQRRCPVEARRARPACFDRIGNAVGGGQIEARPCRPAHCRPGSGPCRSRDSRSQSRYRFPPLNRVAIAHSICSSENTSTSSSTMKTCFTRGSRAAPRSRAAPPLAASRAQREPARVAVRWLPERTTTATGLMPAARKTFQICSSALSATEIARVGPAQMAAAMEHRLVQDVIAHSDGGDVEHRVHVGGAVETVNSP